MLKSAAVIGFATLVALAASRGLVAVASPHLQPAEAAVAVAPAVQPTPPPPASPITTPPAGIAQISKSTDGHYWAEANVDGRWMKFLVDTGASTVALSAVDAKRLGLDLESLNFDRPVKTANGDTVAAVVVLDHLSVGGARIDNVEAMVVKEGLSTSLLGMSYLGRLSRFEATPTVLILRP